MNEQRSLTITQEVSTTPERVYLAFTTGHNLTLWFANRAEVDPRPGGRFYAWWNDETYACGRFVASEAGERIEFTWRGDSDSAPSVVTVAFAATGEGTKVAVEHRGSDSRGLPDETLERLQRRWSEGLENLASVWGMTGIDLRQARRPLLGIYMGDAAEAGTRGLPEGVAGVVVAGAIDGSGAEAIGLTRGDVIVEADGTPWSRNRSLAPALRGKQAGDKVPIAYFRDGERIESRLVLSSPPQPPTVPSDPKALAQQIAVQYERHTKAADDILTGVSGDEAARRPSEDAWSLREVLAHLMLFERSLQQWISTLVVGQELRAFAITVPARIKALFSRYGTAEALQQALASHRRETVALVEALPNEFIETPDYVRMGQVLIQEEIHTAVHHDQLRRTLEAVRDANTGGNGA